MSESERLNAEDAIGAIEAAAPKRGMSPDLVERAARTFLAATGQPLRSSLLAVLPEDRLAFLNEVFVQDEVGARVDRERAFKLSFFGPSTDVASGLRGPGVVPPDLPPSILDENYAQFLALKNIRAEDAARDKRPAPAQSAQEIRPQLVAPDERSIESGLTDDAGRKTSYSAIAARDPDSMQNQQARARERATMKIANATRARRTR